MPESSPRILIVDDHMDTRVLLARLIERSGYKVSTAGGVSDALALCQREKFDLLICDVGLPDGTGHDLMKKLAGQSPIKGIALSGFAAQDDIDNGRAAGFTEYLVKPIAPDRLMNAIKGALAS